jgi:hypothetical protein
MTRHIDGYVGDSASEEVDTVPMENAVRIAPLVDSEGLAKYKVWS